MKKIYLIPVVLICLWALSACGEGGRVCSATVTDFVFVEDDMMGFKAVAAVLEAEDGEVITLQFKDIHAQKTIIGGSLNISVGAEGRKLTSYDGYSQTFVLDDQIEVAFIIGSEVNVRQKSTGMWVLDK